MEWFTSKLSGDGAPAPALPPAEASSAKEGGGGSAANGLDPSLGVKAIGYFGSFALTINNISGR